MKRLSILLLMCLIGLWLGNRYFQSTQKTAQPNTATSIEVTDFSGKLIRLDNHAERLISLSPHMTENIYSAGAGDSLVGVIDHSDYPEAAQRLPIVGGYQLINQEKIIELNPDLILVWGTGNSSTSVQQLREHGFNIYVDEPIKLIDIAKSIRDIGQLTNHREIAEKAARDYLDSLEILRQRYSKKPQVSVFYQIWSQPLQTVNGNHLINDAIELCSGKNIYKDEPVIAPVINIESLLERNPQVILLSGKPDQRPQWIEQWQQWSDIQAVKNENMFFVNPDHLERYTVRILQGIEQICEQFEKARSK